MAWNLPQQQQTPSPSIPYVAICCPHFSSVSMEWVLKTLGPLLWIPQPDFAKIPKLSRGIQNLDTLRNELVKAALADKAVTHILFLDSDIIAETPSDINQSIRMLLQCNVPCASGLYRAKQKAGFNYAMWMRNPTGGIGYLPISQWTGNWIKVDVIGFGFVLLKRECFERVSYPWFEWGEPYPSEDFVFCEKLNKIGIDVRVFCEVKLSHEGSLKVLTDGKVSTLDA